MSQTLSDFSQLKRSMFKQQPEQPEKVKPEPVLKTSEVRAELEYFKKRLPGGLTQKPDSDPSLDASRDAERIAALEKELAAKSSALAEMTAAKEALDREFTSAQTQLAQSQAEVTRFKNQCAQLQRDLQAHAESTPVASEPEPAPLPKPEKKAPALLTAVPVEEIFPGELREILLSTLQDACAQAERSGRERRAYLLQALLSGNKPTGELARRCDELRQLLRNINSANDIKAIEKLGFKFITGRTHWKYKYGNTQVTLAKTPSDFRSHRNAENEITNKCF